MASQTASGIQEIVVTREFDAPRERVWQAWTDPEMVRRWYGPEGFTAPSIRIDLRVGGKYIWSMRGPAGSPTDRVMYIAGVYKEIVPNQKLVVVEYRSDENGDVLPSMGGSGPQSDYPSQLTYTVQFEELTKGKTRLSITYPKPETEQQYQALLKSGMVEGWNSSFKKLSQALAGAAG